jgi:hypothetical protein
MTDVFRQLEILRSPARAGDSRLRGTGIQRANMKNRSRAGAGVIISLGLFFGLGSFADSRRNSQFSNANQKETVLTKHASGTFEVKLDPQAPEDKVGDPTVGRMLIDKQFHGDLEAISRGQMLAAGTEVKGSAGYVAIERVTGKLNGHSGTFALQHSGIMTRGVPQLTITVVPDSGTGELIELAGKMTIDIVDGKHFYDFEYTLAEAH